MSQNLELDWRQVQHLEIHGCQLSGPSLNPNHWESSAALLKINCYIYKPDNKIENRMGQWLAQFIRAQPKPPQSRIIGP